MHGAPPDAWPALPTETDIYLLPDGRVVITDLPVELAELAGSLGPIEPCAVTLPPAGGEQSHREIAGETDPRSIPTVDARQGLGAESNQPCP